MDRVTLLILLLLLVSPILHFRILSRRGTDSAGGPWTSSVLPDSHRSVEATMGTVMFVDIPSHRQDLRKKFHPDNFPVWRFIQGEGDG